VEKLEYKGSVVKKCQEGQTCKVNFKHICRPGEEIYKTYDEEFMKLTKQTYNKEFLALPVKIKAAIHRGTKIICSLSDGKNTVLEETQIIPREAEKKAISIEEIKTQLSKLGGTPYQAEKIEIELDEGLWVSVKEMNEIRRNLVEKLNQRRIEKYNRESKLFVGSKRKVIKKTPHKIKLTYAVSNVSQLRKLLDMGAATIYYKDLETLPLALEIWQEKDNKGKIIPEIFRLTSDTDLDRYTKMISDLKTDTVLIQSYGHINKFKGLRLIGDYNFNIINDYSYNFYINNGFERITLSPELNLAQISAMDLVPGKTEIVGYGYLPVMAMKHCVIATTLNKEKHCGLCYQDSYSLIDKMNEKFKIMRRYQCSTEIHNSKKLMLIENYKALEMAGIGYFRINFLDETPEEVEIAANLHRKFISSELTSEDFSKIDSLKYSGVTYGHLNRGID